MKGDTYFIVINNNILIAINTSIAEVNWVKEQLVLNQVQNIIEAEELCGINVGVTCSLINETIKL